MNQIIYNHHIDYINCLTILKDGRSVSCSTDNSTIIYNKSTYKLDLGIKEDIFSVLSINNKYIKDYNILTNQMVIVFSYTKKREWNILFRI